MASAYTQGHSESVVASHASRTVHNSAAFLLPHIKPHFTIVDLGCGPGTITRGFCQFVPQGSVIGIDASEAVIAQAETLAPQSEYPNLSFRVGDVTARLPFDNDSVDVIYTHQTLCHIPSPIPVIKEALRVLKPGGMLAMREADTISWYPENAGIVLYSTAQHRAISSTGAQGPMGSGRRLHVWALAAGFERAKITVGAGTTVYSAADEANWWASVCIGRVESEVGQMWLRNKIVLDQGEIDAMKTGFKAWGQSEEAWYSVLQGEVICRK